jgi:hypothetical protein
MEPRSTAASPTIDSAALLALPAVDELSDTQVRGSACVWCAVVLSPKTAVDLGQRTGDVTWFPRGCRPCAGIRAYEALLDHAPTCEQCVDDGRLCTTGVGLRRLVREGRR